MKMWSRQKIIIKSVPGIDFLKISKLVLNLFEANLHNKQLKTSTFFLAEKTQGFEIFAIAGQKRLYIGI